MESPGFPRSSNAERNVPSASSSTECTVMPAWRAVRARRPPARRGRGRSARRRRDRLRVRQRCRCRARSAIRCRVLQTRSPSGRFPHRARRWSSTPRIRLTRRSAVRSARGSTTSAVTASSRRSTSARGTAHRGRRPVRGSGCSRTTRGPCGPLGCGDERRRSAARTLRWPLPPPRPRPTVPTRALEVTVHRSAAARSGPRFRAPGGACSVATRAGWPAPRRPRRRGAGPRSRAGAGLHEREARGGEGREEEVGARTPDARLEQSAQRGLIVE